MACIDLQRLLYNYDEMICSLLAATPNSSGFPGSGKQSSYYPCPKAITKNCVTAIAEMTEKNSIEPENHACAGILTGLRLSSIFYGHPVRRPRPPLEVSGGDYGLTVCLVPGDDAGELSRVCAVLQEAAKYASNSKQVKVSNEHRESFTTGSTESYRRLPRTRITDVSPRVESILGLFEPYWDPQRVRGYFSISDPEEMRTRLVNDLARIISLLPWASMKNDRKGPYEASFF